MLPQSLNPLTHPLRMLAGAGLLLAAAQANAALSLSFQVISTPISVGDTFTVDLYANDIFSDAGHGATDEVTSFGYDWDLSVPSLLSLIGSPTLTPNLSDPYTDGAITADVVAFAATDPIVNDTNPVNALITSFQFTALQAGSTVFSIDGSVPDPNFERGFYYLDLTDPIGFSGNTTITVQDVPVPAPLMLMTAGLIGLWLRRR